ncbi:MAG: hypothetical protein E7563_01365 [Ruminococcaceae bacterium]|nr:hypothetical protein [Oscillospiraceae bacterium]
MCCNFQEYGNIPLQSLVLIYCNMNLVSKMLSNFPRKKSQVCINQPSLLYRLLPLLSLQLLHDNVSGMSLSRKGIFEITDAIEAKLIDAIIVKDLSRLGRHETETAAYIEYTRKKEIHIFSATEGIDTLDENNRLVISVKGIFNDMYVRDIARKVSAGMLQKQKEGLVITPPMGYFKDKNTGEVVIVEEHAQIVRRIFKLYLEGYGVKSIAKMFNDEGIKSAGYYQKKLYGKRLGYNKPEIGHKYLWDNTGVKRILQNEFYAGTLVCHKTYTSKITHIRKDIPEEEQYRHENAVPAIVSREIWE